MDPWGFRVVARPSGLRYYLISVAIFWVAIWLKTAPLDNSVCRSRRHGSYYLCQ